ncbi:Gfo/Idh/MocA family protein [Stratiformator vulcanicus]|uniref:Putative oxidoreductase YcjS n=1 Tax=Stratiformator vulcanicus TaxID=2527980 RepID=A0A517R0R5_9PLAN|nr:Gfo/Idh/MocA family oxidoreductase [Stratiformator vulcanicus]QDT37495.1 putative oxidoreductase YcjS [Stratiformator vulcanicus]
MSNPTNTDRRKFLGQSVAAAAAASLAPFTFPTALAKAKQDVNSTLRVAVLGLRSRGKTHLNGFINRNNCEVVAVVDPDEGVGQKKGVEEVYKRTGKRPKYYNECRAAADAQDIDIFSVATPNHWHALQAIWGIQSGKDVYVEKPVSHNVEEGRRIVDAARKYDQVCQFGAQCRTMKGTREMVQYVLNGGIGEVKLARGLCYKRRKSIGPAGSYGVPQGVNYSEWLGPAPMLSDVPRKQFHYDWHWQWPYGNGDLGNQGIHQMDVARWGLGVENIGDSVVAYGGRLGYEDAGTTANTEVSIHTFPNGKKLVFETRGLETDAYKQAKIGVIFYGSEGYAVQHSYGRSSVFDKDWNKVKSFGGGSTNDHFDNFVEGVRNRDRTVLNGEILDGHLSSALCHLGNISYRLGEESSESEIRGALDGNDEAVETFDRTVSHLKKNGVDLGKTPLALGPKLMIDPSKEKFVGVRSEEANPMLTREYREPFVVPSAESV